MSARSENAENKSIKTDIHNEELAEGFETRCCECLKKLRAKN